MPHLVDLQGRPLSWATLHARNEAYWRAREEQERFDSVHFDWYVTPNGTWRLAHKPVASA